MGSKSALHLGRPIIYPLPVSCSFCHKNAASCFYCIAQQTSTATPQLLGFCRESISSLHAGEHFGLGRYGDPVDPIAHLKFIQSLTRVLAPGGRLYFSVPSGVEQLLFNAHRVFAPETVVNAFSGLELLSFSCVKDDGAFYENCSPSEISKEMYGCGFYEYTKLEGK